MVHTLSVEQTVPEFAASVPPTSSCYGSEPEEKKKQERSVVLLSSLNKENK